jgi:hypothetical protein
MYKAGWLLLILVPAVLQAQVSQFAYIQNFDTVVVPNLPSGWSTTTNRSPSGDFKTTSSTVRSSPKAVVDLNATIA